MSEIYLTPGYMPFAISFVIMLGIGLIEAIGLGLGQFELDTDVGHDAEPAGMLDWLGIGAGLPVLIWLTLFLGCFTIAGVALQQVVATFAGSALSWPIAAGGALVIGGVLNRFAARGLARIMPGYESSVISTDDLLMRRGTVLEGQARRGQPARARVVDQHRQAHYVMIEPHHDSDVIGHGETALLVRKEGAIFFAVPDADTLLRPI